MLKTAMSWLESWLPTALPTTDTEFSSWTTAVLALGSWPDNDSTRQALASLLMHLGPTTVYKPKRYFYLAVRKSVVNQQAYNIIQDVNRVRQSVQLAQVQEAAGEMVPKA